MTDAQPVQPVESPIADNTESAPHKHYPLLRTTDTFFWDKNQIKVRVECVTCGEQVLFTLIADVELKTYNKVFGDKDKISTFSG